MAENKYPKNWKSNGVGWVNPVALTYGRQAPHQPPSEQSSGVFSFYPPGGSNASNNSSSSSGIGWSLGGGGGSGFAAPAPQNIGEQLTYGFAPNVAPCQVPNARHAAPPPQPAGFGSAFSAFGGGASNPNIGWAVQADTGSFDSGPSDVPSVQQAEVPYQSIFVPEHEQRPHHGVFYVSDTQQQFIKNAVCYNCCQ